MTTAALSLVEPAQSGYVMMLDPRNGLERAAQQGLLGPEIVAGNVIALAERRKRRILERELGAFAAEMEEWASASAGPASELW